MCTCYYVSLSYDVCVCSSSMFPVQTLSSPLAQPPLPKSPTLRRRKSTPVSCTWWPSTASTSPSANNNPHTCLGLLASLFELMSAVVEARGAEASLRWKAFLKCAYGLTDDRCLSFNPTDTPSSLSTASTSGMHRLSIRPKLLKMWWITRPYSLQPCWPFWNPSLRELRP